MRTTTFASLGIILLSFLIGLYLYPQMPETVASHWNARGEADGYMPKFWGLFLLPLISLGLLLLLVLIPKIDPLKANIETFRKYYDGFVVLMMAFLFYLYLLTVLWNIDIRFDMLRALAPAFGALLYYTGVLVENAKRNWSIGIRTPWTLSSDRVWEKTHKLGGRLFKIAGAIAVVGAFFGSYGIVFILVPVILFAAYAMVYSYLQYQKELK